MQVFLDRLATLPQVQLQNFKIFSCHDTITVVVVCTIAGAKVQLNHNCYNVYFQRMLTKKQGCGQKPHPCLKSLCVSIIDGSTDNIKQLTCNSLLTTLVVLQS